MTAVKDIVDEDGNTLAQSALQGSLVDLTENVLPVAEELILVDDKTIYVSMSEKLTDPNATNPDTAKIKVYVNGTEVKHTSNAMVVDWVGATGTDAATLSIVATDANTFSIGDKIKVEFLNGTTIADANGNKVAPASIEQQF
ncbi:hypothetical protein T458_05970 [Brevibacillus panacihumi W25]|uniref:Uncharacterized protein n=1 Tax=Brevibacillus panacihumi W25 TaxID=1408254 RepID=V6MBP4_9BACL|nr:hypothetical protein T458_05970 [Brevibacillus panacihumi W25]